MAHDPRTRYQYAREQLRRHLLTHAEQRLVQDITEYADALEVALQTQQHNMQLPMRWLAALVLASPEATVDVSHDQIAAVPDAIQFQVVDTGDGVRLIVTPDILPAPHSIN